MTPSAPWRPGARMLAFHRAMARRHRSMHLHASEPFVFVAPRALRTNGAARGALIHLNLAVTMNVNHAWTLTCDPSIVMPALLRLVRVQQDRIVSASRFFHLAAGTLTTIDRSATQPWTSTESLPGEVAMPLAAPVRPETTRGVRRASSRRDQRTAGGVVRSMQQVHAFATVEHLVRLAVRHATHAMSIVAHAMTAVFHSTHESKWASASHITQVYAPAALTLRSERARFAGSRPSLLPGRAGEAPALSLMAPAGRSTRLRVERDVIGPGRVEAFVTERLRGVHTLDERLSTSSTWRTTASTFAETRRIVERSRSTEWLVDEPSMAMRRPPQVEPAEDPKRIAQERAEQEEVIRTVRRTVVEENERAARHAARQLPSPQQLADEVYGLLTRRLVTERERLGR